ncbi:MAG: bifunctional 5,10-methylenetetrahydrofolate dehydrogenase/5,10-methenyltetrahydrofolate cyclohydrolase [Oscillospiraceae bacterium]|nr:bifunctional 5,10-methylenetetrahydrofolate dehydrogenase/5,10-methenyltetrahydrofolate cyclohydrolase [Oscillospiraceae bacterium]
MIIDGKSIANEILESSKIKIKSFKVLPCLAAVVVGDYEASAIYVRNKARVCQQVGIEFLKYKFPSNIQQKKIIDLIKKLNSDKNITAILVQLPLPRHIDKRTIIESISPLKDVDAFTSENFSKAVLKNSNFWPCTPSGIIHLIKYTGIKIESSNCIVIGRSEIVGKPLALALLNLDASVTICHSKTINLTQRCIGADILISAVGNPKLVTENMVKPKAVVIDVGINYLDGKLCGDVDFEKVSKIASYITPVPGGVGPMTIAFLIKNILTLYENNLRTNES